VAAPHERTRASAVDVALDGLPVESRFIMAVDVARVIATPVGARLAGFLKEAFARVASGIDLKACTMSISHVGLVVFGGDGEGPGMSALATTSITASALFNCLDAVMHAKGSSMVRENVGGREAYHAASDSPSDNAWFAPAGPGRLAMAGTREWLAHTIEPDAARARTNAPLAAAATRVDATAPVWFVMLFAPDVRAAMLKSLPEGLDGVPSAMRFSVQLSDSVTLDLVASFDNPEYARQAAELGRILLERARQQLAASEFADVLAALTVSSEGNEARVHFMLDAQQVDRVAPFLARALNLQAHVRGL